MKRSHFALLVSVTASTVWAKDTTLACDNDALNYLGSGWSGVAQDMRKLPNGSPATIRSSTSADAAVEVSFTGTGLAWRGWKATNQGDVSIVVDGGKAVTANAHEDTADAPDPALDIVTIWSTTGLTNGAHKIKFSNTAADQYLWIYQFIATAPDPPAAAPPPPPPPPPPATRTATTVLSITATPPSSSSPVPVSSSPTAADASSTVLSAPPSSSSSFVKSIRSSSISASASPGGFIVVPAQVSSASLGLEDANQPAETSSPTSGRTVGIAAGAGAAGLAAIVILLFCLHLRRSRRADRERAAAQERDYQRGLALWSELKTLAASSSGGASSSHRSPRAFHDFPSPNEKTSPAYAMDTFSPFANLAYDVRPTKSAHDGDDDDDDAASGDSYSIDGTKRRRPGSHARQKSLGYPESLCDPDAENAASELRKGLTDQSWKRRLPSSQAIMQLGGAADVPPVPPLPVDKSAWVGQWAAAQAPPTHIGPIDALSPNDAHTTIGALTLAMQGRASTVSDNRSDAQTSISRRHRPRAPPGSPTVELDVPMDMDERSVRDTVWL